jgi:hypothetical protein
MICRLYGENDATKFKLRWVPLIHQILKEKVFNWAHILSANIKTKVKKSRKAPLGYCPRFFMFVYLIDVVCVVKPFSFVSLELVLC